MPIGEDVAVKEAGESCPHMSSDHTHAAACGIYDGRPDVCRKFKCSWLAGALESHERPDRIGVIVEFANKSGFDCWYVHETKNVLDEPLTYASQLVRRIRESARDVGLIVVITRYDGSQVAYMPDGSEEYPSGQKSNHVRLPII